jgi:hypothetical protein
MIEYAFHFIFGLNLIPRNLDDNNVQQLPHRNRTGLT